MQTLVRKVAHVFERVGLAMAGAASGLFVGIHVGSNIALLTSQGFLLVMMISGAIGFYLGIDTPQQTFDDGPTRKIDSAEFLSAAGTFLAALTAFVSVGVIVLRDNTHLFWTTILMLAWTIGVTMQIVAGAIARVRAR
jgi:archaellum biogenesis protein FlaJ (TadC family)